jgi:hypothetical protein
MMRGVLMAILILMYSTCVKQESSRAQAQISAQSWLSTSAHIVAAIQKRLHLGCVYVVHNGVIDFGKFTCIFLGTEQRKSKGIYALTEKYLESFICIVQ